MKSLPPILAALALLLLPLGAYVGGYFWLGEVEEQWINSPDDGGYARVYRQEWAWTIYKPAGKVEAWLTGIAVDIAFRDPNYADWVYEYPED